MFRSPTSPSPDARGHCSARRRNPFAGGRRNIGAGVGPTASAAKSQPAFDAKLRRRQWRHYAAPGFCATVFADNIGHARQLVVAPDGVVYVNTWSGRYYGNDTPPPGGFLVALKDTKGDGHADIVERFGDGVRKAATAAPASRSTTARLMPKRTTASSATRLPTATIAPNGPPQCRRLRPAADRRSSDASFHDRPARQPLRRSRLGDQCLPRCKTACCNSPGISPAPSSRRAAAPGATTPTRPTSNSRRRSAMRPVCAMAKASAFDAAGRLFVTQHGRDQLCAELAAALHAEARRQAAGGGNGRSSSAAPIMAGRNAITTAAEEAGAGAGIWRRRRQEDRHSARRRRAPVAVVPGALGAERPADLQRQRSSRRPIAAARSSPSTARGIARRCRRAATTSCSSRSPTARLSGDFVVFADGFAGAVKEPGRAAFRPSGLAMGPDGALYISDDVHGRIWRVTYHGGPTTASVAAAPAPATAASIARRAVRRKAFIPTPARSRPSCPRPGATPEEVALGDRIFHGEVGGGTCAGCHGSDAKGTPLGPDLTTSKWLWGDGSLQLHHANHRQRRAQARRTIAVRCRPMGGAQLSPSETSAVAAYVWAISHRAGG